MSLNTLRVRRAILGLSVVAFSVGVIGSSTNAIMASGTHTSSHGMSAMHRYGE